MAELSSRRLVKSILGYVMEGFRLHPDDEVLGYSLARLLFNIKNYDTARTVIGTFLERETAGMFKRRFLDLEDQIIRAPSPVFSQEKNGQ